MSTDISRLTQAGQELEAIPVSLSYDIIRLFSEGLYQSPHKAIEELVSNSYDAEAKNVHVLLPDQNDEDIIPAHLWVIDDGHGMNADEFHRLWRVAHSTKTDASPSEGRRLPIGQFGIGKLAAYVLAWNLIHISRVNNRFRLTVMDFHVIEKLSADNPGPIKISLREIDEQTARSFLSDIEKRDSNAWDLLFGTDHLNTSWTVAGLSDFRGLYDKLSVGRLKWVLSTGLPLHTNFKIYLDGDEIKSSKLRPDPLDDISIREELELGTITGSAQIYEKPLTAGKSVRVGRSHGFFIRVRGRVINLEDELFGITQPNHAAWSRFTMEVHAEGLQTHLLSSREGVRDSAAIREFREYLQKTFNQCRRVYQDWHRNQVEELDIQALLSDMPSHHILEPLLSGIQFTLESGEDSFYISATRDSADQDVSVQLAGLREQIAVKPFKTTNFVQHGPHAAAVRYDPGTRNLAVNTEHPFVNKLTNDDRNRNPAKLFAPSEVLLEGLLKEYGTRKSVIADILQARNRVLRLMAGETLPTASEALRLLRVANHNEHALERATGSAFRVLGFEYERRGGNKSGPDGILSAHLGRHGDSDRGYKLVYDAKHTNKPTVQADKIDPSSLEDFRLRESAAYGFFITDKYASENDPDGKINRKIFSEQSSQNYESLTLLKIAHLERLLKLHFRHGLTLTDIGNMFEECRTIMEVDDWITEMQRKFSESEVPLATLFEILEGLKEDDKAVPNVKAARMVNNELKKFEPNRLIARLKAVEIIIGDRWLQVEDSGDVKMSQTGMQILRELDRQIGTLDN